MRDPNGLDQHEPGAKLDADKRKLWGEIRPVWALIRFRFLDLEEFEEIDDFFSRRTGVDVYDVHAGDLRYSHRAPSEILDSVSPPGVYGATKYTVDGWRSVQDGANRYLDAAARHYWALLCGEMTDHESGLPHVFHARWNVLASAALRA